MPELFSEPDNDTNNPSDTKHILHMKLCLNIETFLQCSFVVASHQDCAQVRIKVENVVSMRFVSLSINLTKQKCISFNSDPLLP